MYVDGVERPLVVLQADRGGGDCLVVLGTDDDDDQVLFLGKGIKKITACFHPRFTRKRAQDGADYYIKCFQPSIIINLE